MRKNLRPSSPMEGDFQQQEKWESGALHTSSRPPPALNDPAGRIWHVFFFLVGRGMLFLKQSGCDFTGLTPKSAFHKPTAKGHKPGLEPIKPILWVTERFSHTDNIVIRTIYIEWRDDLQTTENREPTVSCNGVEMNLFFFLQKQSHFFSTL